MTERLIDGYDGVLADLDGVVYTGPRAISGATKALAKLAGEGKSLAYVTNNASRSSEQVAAHLRELGAPASANRCSVRPWPARNCWPDRLLPGRQSSSSGARPSRTRSGHRGSSSSAPPMTYRMPSSRVLAWAGMEGPGGGCLRRGRGCGLGGHEHRYVPSAGARDRAGERYARGGSCRCYREVAIGRGKARGRPLRAAARHSDIDRAIVVGDRLDTDILGGNRAGMATALVLTGVDSVHTALAARVDERPDYLIGSLEDLYEQYPAVTLDGTSYSCGGAVASATDSTVTISGCEDDLDSWRAACAAWWAVHPEVTPASAPEVSFTTAR